MSSVPPPMHRWERIVTVFPAYKTPSTGYRCTVCGSTVGTGTGMDSATFPCPGPSRRAG